jgi:hypothetical protein
MLAVYTEHNNITWLQYILDEFKRINKAEFEIIVIIEKAQLLKYKNVISYTQRPQKGFSVYDSSRVKPGKIVVPYQDNIFCFPETISPDKEYSIQFDIFWNAFIILSRLEEYLVESKGSFLNSYLKNHPRKDKSVFQKPLVNNLFDFYEGKIKLFFPELKFGTFSKPVVELSHDVDYLKKTIQLRGKQTVFNAYNFCRNFYKKESFSYLKKTFVFLFSNPSYWCFDYWTELEKGANRQSVFYIYARRKHQKGIKSFLIDPSYDIFENNRLKNQLMQMHDQGFEIGLHGSYNSAIIPGVLEEEKECLEKAIGFPVTKTRQHWLNYREATTPYFHNSLFRFDSTLGWNDAIGFRSGSASAYRPYDHINDKPFSFFEVPQIIMDSHIFDYSAGNVFKAQILVAETLKSLHSIKNTHVSISWHQRVCSSDYKWSEYYENIIKDDL